MNKEKYNVSERFDFLISSNPPRPDTYMYNSWCYHCLEMISTSIHLTQVRQLSVLAKLMHVIIVLGY